MKVEPRLESEICRTKDASQATRWQRRYLQPRDHSLDAACQRAAQLFEAID
jgi:hypothetical protein